MSLKNTLAHYGSVAKMFHWLTALLILTLFPLGVIAQYLPFETAEQLAQKAWLFSLHKTLGVTVFFVALLRILWAISQPKPSPVHPERRFETFAAETAHWVLYSALVIVPLSGWIHHAASEGFAPIWWPLGQNLPLVPKSETLAALSGGVHFVTTKVMLAALLAHIAGALKHSLIERDGVLARMWFGASPDIDPAPEAATPWPPITAIAVWLAAIAVGSGLGAFNTHHPSVSSVALEQASSEWHVEGGELALTVTQFGAPISGQFKEWTAAIEFDESILEGTAGSADVTIAIGSLALGSVSAQAMGADYFDVATFPTARFQADLINTPGGYLAQGTLTIKGHEIPIEMPFELSLAGERAQASGTLTLNRLDFGIGENLADESSLSFRVEVTFSVEAHR